MGTWVNLGAGTQVADLRTDYGNVRAAFSGRTLNTGRLKLGACIGDHTKTGVATLLDAGTVIGAFACILPGRGLAPRTIPSFCRWRDGRLEERSDLRRLFATARTALQRRDCVWSTSHDEFYFEIFERTVTERRRSVQDNDQRSLRPAV